ncbi:MAG: PhzF family phenazine biosynthesis protein [Solobacterium sp.]|nr:PhzF family phenazine biosynthesis protein [Solobacterium sp.]
MKQYIVDAFTEKPFSGNPAAVCVMDRWPKEEYMRNLAMENSLSETAFLVREEQGYHLRWFTPLRRWNCAGMRPWLRDM